MSKSFNLEAALSGEHVVTRSGLDVVGLAHFPTLPVMRQIVFVVEGAQWTSECDVNGHYYPDLKRDSSYDLFMKGPKVKVVKALRDLSKGEQI